MMKLSQDLRLDKTGVFKVDILRLICFTICFGLSLTVHGQQALLTGGVRDSLAGIDLEEATVVVLDARDSILVDYTYTDSDGRFRLDLRSGNYLLMVSYADYADYVSPIVVGDQGARTGPITIHLSKKSRILEEVIVNAKPMDVVVKGDTIEFNAGAYSTAPHAKVEDLLKQLPGIEVDFNGRIKAYGQVVNRVLVDGEEFFGDDPTLVTRNLRGDMVDKVQLYDKKSDLAELTGVDIGEKEKTINIKLKEDKKEGYFGKVDAGKGTGRYYQGQGMFNKFAESSKFAAYVNTATTGLVDLRGSDRKKFGVTGGTIEFINGNVALMGVKYDELSTSSGRYEGIGEPRSISGGTHYDRKWDADKQRINANFKTGNLIVSGQQTTLSENTLPESVLISNSVQQFRNNIARDRIDASYEFEPDTVTMIKFSIEGLKRKTQRNSGYQVDIQNDSKSLVSESTRSLNEEGHQSLLDVSAVYSKKLNSNGRSLTLNMGGSYGSIRSEGLLNAARVFMTGPGEVDREIIDQTIDSDLDQRVIMGTATYTDRLAKGVTGSFSYGIGSSEDKTERNSFDNTAPGGWQSPISEFSVDFLLNQLSNHIDLALYYQIDEHALKAGNKAAVVNFKQRDRSGHENLTRDFVTWKPEFSYSYRPRQGDLLSFKYTGTDVLPSSLQLQPAQLNDDPLNVVAGNPGLQPAYKHDFSLSYRSSRPKSGLYLNLISHFNFTEKPMASSMETDGSGKTVYMPVNLPDVETTDLLVRFNFGKQIKKFGMYTGLELNVSAGNIYGLSNGVLQKRTIQRYSAGVNVSRNREAHFFRLSVSPYYDRNFSSLNTLLSNSGGGLKGNLTFGITLPKDFRLSGSGQYDYQESTDVFPEGIDMFTVSTALEKKFLKSKALSLTLSVNDLLNQNQGFNRSSFGTTVTQNTYTAIQRYFMLSVAWDIARFGSNP